MGNVITHAILQRFLLVKTDFDKDQIWTEHFPLIQYPKKNEWLALIRESVLIDDVKLAEIVSIKRQVTKYYGRYGHPEDSYIHIVSDTDRIRYDTISKEDCCHFEQLVFFLLRDCYQLVLSISPFAANCQMVLQDDPGVKFTVRDLCHLIADNKIYCEAKQSFEEHLKLQEK